MSATPVVDSEKRKHWIDLGKPTATGAFTFCRERCRYEPNYSHVFSTEDNPSYHEIRYWLRPVEGSRAMTAIASNSSRGVETVGAGVPELRNRRGCLWVACSWVSYRQRSRKRESFP